MDPIKSAVPLDNPEHATPLADIVVGLNYMRQHGVDANVLRMSKETLRMIGRTREVAYFASEGQFNYLIGKAKSPAAITAALLRAMIELAFGYERQFLVSIGDDVPDGKILMFPAD